MGPTPSHVQIKSHGLGAQQESETLVASWIPDHFDAA